jgi:signal transduction histidine kinase
MFSTYKGLLFVLVTGILLFYLITKEIGRRNQIYNQLLEAKRKADESDRLKSTFLANLSHYIRTPMNSILGFVELIEDKDTSPDNQQIFMSYINESSQNLLQTLNSIIEISKIQEGLAQVACEKTSVNQLIERVAATARVDISTTNKPVFLSIKTGLPDGEDLISSDPHKISLVLSNLVSNAIRFTGQGEIEIGYSQVEPSLELWVRDTGKGISEQKQATLFVDFLQNTSTTNIAEEGAGLGLALAARLSALLGGKLWLKTTGPEGSIFCMSIPNQPA